MTGAVRAVTLIANPTSAGGGAAKVLDAVADGLESRGVHVERVRSRSVEHTVEAARTACDRGDVVGAVGGDGMLRIVAAAIVGRPGAVFAAIPAGRGNDFVGAVGLPTETDAVVDALVEGVAVPIDTGRAVGADGVPHPYLTIAACGFDADANQRANDAPSRLGPLAYVWGMLGTLRELRPIPYRLTHDDGSSEVRALTVVVANTARYGGGMRVAPDATPSDGRFDVVVIEHSGPHPDRCTIRDRARLLRSFPGVFRGDHVALPEVRVERTAEIHVAADGPLAVFADGDPIGTLPMTFTVDTEGLQLIVPRTHPLASPAPAPVAPTSA
ncbi:MAG: diacylglycerol kinase family protein [Patulibacter sp.]